MTEKCKPRWVWDGMQIVQQTCLLHDSQQVLGQQQRLVCRGFQQTWWARFSHGPAACLHGLMKQPCRALSFNCLPRIPRRNLDGAHLGSAGKGWLLRRWLESRRPRLRVKICSRRGCPQEFVSRFVPLLLLTKGNGKGSRASRARHSSAWPSCLPPSLDWVLAMRYGAGAFSFFQEKGKLNIDYHKCWYLSLNEQTMNAPNF